MQGSPWFVTSGSYPVRAGNRVAPLVDGEPAFRRIAEVVDRAQSSVWVTVAFLWDTFQLPDGRGSFFDLLDRAAARGLDVRVVFWRPGDELARFRPNAFWGSPEHRRRLADPGSRVLVRWDRAPTGFCHHQKSWVVDAGLDTATAFVGGINLNPHSVVAPGHRGEGQNHDAYVQLAGPSTADVAANFVQRWNEASERERRHGVWPEGSRADLPEPDAVVREQGSTTVQVQRNLPSGERSILDQYRIAIAAARHSIYIENQALETPDVIGWLGEALGRGVEVTLVMPGEVDRRPVAGLTGFSNFALVALASRGDAGQRNPVYVHSKLMLVDDAWATIGSCNLHAASMGGNSELNVSFWDPGTVGALRRQLFVEHLGEGTGALDAAAAHRRFGQIASHHARRWQAGDAAWPGLAYALDSLSHGR